MNTMAKLPLTSYLICFVLLGTQTAAVTGTINPDEPFMVVGKKNPGNHLSFAPLDTLEFTNVYFSELTQSSNDFSYDPVDKKLYFTNGNAGLWRANLDGTQQEHVVTSGIISGVAVDPDTRNLFYCGIFGVKGYVFMSNLDGSNATKKADVTQYGYYTHMTRVGSRIYAGYAGPRTGLDCLDSSSGDYIAEGSYEMTNDIPEYVAATTLDVAGGKLFWIDSDLHLFRQSIDDVNSTCVQAIFEVGAVLQYGTDISFHQDYIYMSTNFGPPGPDDLLSGLIRIHKSGSAFEDIGNFDILDGATFGLYIHDPAKNAAEQGFVGGVLNDTGITYTTPVNMTFPVTDITQWFGGMIIDIAIPITGPIIDWHLEISFPRRIFKLEIEGCDAEISDVIQRQYGRRKGTDYVIIPSGPNSRFPPPGEDLTIRFIVKAWKYVRGMKRGITAHFVPVPDILQCDFSAVV